jgi:hypothetical protein
LPTIWRLVVEAILDCALIVAVRARRRIVAYILMLRLLRGGVMIVLFDDSTKELEEI